MSGRRRRTADAGTAYLVGAGPGDPGLLTVRARELLEKADVIVYDALANPELLQIPREAGREGVELRDVGKRGGDAEGSARQEEINNLLVALVRQGKKVVRLKGGDPFVFGRGGEEAEALAEAGLPFEVVPGITAGIAAPAYAGIPVTHRGMSTSVTLVTGHEDPLKGAPQTDWGALARTNGTIVLYMGMQKLAGLARALMDGGLPGSIPAAAIQWGTHPAQRTLVATLETIAERAEREGFGAPAITVIGWTVVLRDTISWFDRRPLFGQRILVTRAGEAHAAGGLSAQLREQGADVVEIAGTRIEYLDAAPLKAALDNLAEYNWLLFTSANAVTRFWHLLAASGRDSRALASLRVGAVGPGTAGSLALRGINADAVARTFSADGLVTLMAEQHDVTQVRALWPCAQGARPTLQDGIERRGGSVERLHIYRSVEDRAKLDAIRAEVESGRLSLAAFTSASAVNAFAAALDAASLPGVRAASIGPVTSEALRAAGIPVVLEAPQATLESLVKTIVLSTAGDDLE